jgi:hypothetical protein
MALESLLAELRVSVPHSKKAPNAEKTGYLAHINQLMKRHQQAGRQDSRGTHSRKDLLRMGVPLEQRASSSAPRPDVSWRTSSIAQWRKENPVATPEQESQELQRLAATWAGMSTDERSTAFASLRPLVPMDIDDASEPDGSSDSEHDIFDHGNSKWPVRSGVLGEFVHSHCAHSAAGLAGVASKAYLIRQVESPALLVFDDKDIPDDRMLEHRLSCSEAHPGLCAFVDRDIYFVALKLAKSIEAALDSSSLHKFIMFFEPYKDSMFFKQTHIS